MTAPDEGSLRRAALAVCVLRDLDLHPVDDGVVLEGVVDTHVPWRLVGRVLEGIDPDGADARRRLGDWLVARRFVADRSLTELSELAAPIGMPVEHPHHPGLGWVAQRVLGGALDVGLGLTGLDPAAPHRTCPLPGGVAEHAGVDTAPWWHDAVEHLEDMGTMAVLRWRRNPDDPVRPMGNCDVVTLLGSRILRHAVAAHHQGMAPVAVPMRTRGWLDLARIDPAFAVAAAAATSPQDRGFSRPLLVTGDEIVLAMPGGQPARLALLDAVRRTPHPRQVGRGGSLGG